MITLDHLASLLRVDQRARWQQGEPIRVEAYLAQHPRLRANPEVVLDLIYHEMVLRQERGETPQLAEYLQRFGNLEGEVRRLFEVDRALEEVSWGGLASLAEEPACILSIPPAPKLENPLPSIPDYEVYRELGRGGMSIVYHAQHTPLKRQVALKMLLAGHYANSTELGRFRTEAEAVARLDHPNIVRIYEVGEHEDKPWVSLEYVPGGTLEGKVASTPQPEREAAHLLEAVARAVHYAHQRGIIHRDLKPANVLLTADGTPKVADFGLARLLDTESGLTPTEAYLGTPNYMAPEQAEGRAREVGVLSDVYALGGILYHLLTGFAPFQGRSFLEALELVRKEDPLPPSCCRQRLSRDLETICLKCLEKTPSRRYPSAEALADDLARFLDGQPIQARRASPWYRAWRTAGRHSVLLTRVLAGAAAVVLGLMLLWWALVGGPQWAQQEVEKRNREFSQHRDDAFLYCLLSPEQVSLFTGPEAAASASMAEAAVRDALARVGMGKENATGEPPSNLDEPSRTRILHDCHALLLILAETRVRQSRPGESKVECYREALDILDRAPPLGVQTRAYHQCRSDLLSRLGENEAARQEQQQARDIPPEDVLDRFLHGVAQYQQGYWKAAASTFRESLEKHPGHFWTKFFLAVCRLQTGDQELARDGFTACLEQQPGFPWAYLFRSCAKEKLKAWDEAEDDFQKALACLPNENANARYVLLLVRGIVRFRQKDLARSEQDFLSALALKPKQCNAYVNLAQICLARRDFEQAERYMEQALQLQPPPLVVVGYHLERGRQLGVAGCYDEALQALRECRNLGCNHPLPYALEARILLELSRYDEAERAYADYFRLGGTASAEVYRGRGQVRMKLGRFPEAVEDYSRALELQPDGEIHLHRGWAYFFCDAWKLALRDFQTAVEKMPQESTASIGRGLARVMLGEYREAVADAELALKQGVSSAAMMHNLASIWAEAGERAERDANEPDRSRLAETYREAAEDAVRRTLEMLRPEERRPFWQDKILSDRSLRGLRDRAGFRQLEQDLLPPPPRSNNVTEGR
jgi:serine/threonine-protein kinase